MPVLKQRLEEAGIDFKPQPAKKRFQFGGRTSAMSTAKVIVPLVLGRTLVQVEVFVVENEIPFLLRGNLLRQQKTEISGSENKMTLNNITMKLKLMKSGHMAIPWMCRKPCTRSGITCRRTEPTRKCTGNHG